MRRGPGSSGTNHPYDLPRTLTRTSTSDSKVVDIEVPFEVGYKNRVFVVPHGPRPRGVPFRTSTLT